MAPPACMAMQNLECHPPPLQISNPFPIAPQFNNYVRFGSGVGMSQGLQPLLDALMEEEGVDKVELGRESSELQTVSQVGSDVGHGW